MKSPTLLHSTFGSIVNFKRDSSQFNDSPSKKLKVEDDEKKNVIDEAETIKEILVQEVAKNDSDVKCESKEEIETKKESDDIDIAPTNELEKVIKGNTPCDESSKVPKNQIEDDEILETKEEKLTITESDNIETKVSTKDEENIIKENASNDDTSSEDSGIIPDDEKESPPNSATLKEPTNSIFLFDTRFMNSDTQVDEIDSAVDNSEDSSQQDQSFEELNDPLTCADNEQEKNEDIDNTPENPNDSSNDVVITEVFSIGIDDDDVLLEENDNDVSFNEDSGVEQESTNIEKKIEDTSFESPSKFNILNCQVPCEKVEVPDNYKTLKQSSNLRVDGAADIESSDTDPIESPVLISLSDGEDEDDGTEIELEQCELDLRPLCDNEKCDECGILGDKITMFNPTPGLTQAQAVRDPKLSAIPWEWSVEEGLDVCYRAKNVTIYDVHGHMVPVDKGLLEKGIKIFFSGRVINVVDNTDLQVGFIPIKSPWRRSTEDKLILLSVIEDKIIEYTIDSFSKEYKEALKILEGARNAVALKELSPEKSKGSSTQMVKLTHKSRVDPKLLEVLNNIPRRILPVDTSRNKSNKKSSSVPTKTITDVRKSSRRSSPTKKQKLSDDCDSRSSDNFKAVLNSFGVKSGYGDPLKKILPADLKSCSDRVASFLLFVNERQNIWEKKNKGKSRLTTNEVMVNKWFTNMYRELDRGTQYFRKNIMDTTMADHKISKDIDERIIRKVLFKSIVYRLINEVKTFQAYGGIPDREDMKSFIEFLEVRHREPGSKVFTAAHQNMGLRRLLETFKFVSKNVKELAAGIAKHAKNRSLRGVNEVLLSISNVGGFFSWQILCDLLEARILGENCDNQWTCLGPGAKNGLRRLFTQEKLPTTKGELKFTRLVRDLCAPSGSKSGYEALNIKFPTFLDKPLSLKNVEHALCEYDKYYRSAQEVQIKERQYTENTSNVYLDNESKCKKCDKVGSLENRIKCTLCGSMVHKPCDSRFEKRFVGTAWVCKSCQKVEQAWSQEDYDFEEYDSNDNFGKAYVSGAAKKNSRLKRKGKSTKKAKNKTDVEVVDLSSDEEIGDSDEEDDNDIQMISEDEFDLFKNTNIWAADEEDDEDIVDVKVVSSPKKKPKIESFFSSPVASFLKSPYKIPKLVSPSNKLSNSSPNTKPTSSNVEDDDIVILS